LRMSYKSEYRNPKQIRITKIQNSKQDTKCKFFKQSVLTLDMLGYNENADL